jgi:hypothetical protein
VVTKSSGYERLISTGAIVALIGFILSGPAAFILVKLVKPQPQWVSPAVFAQHYHMVQDVPYYFGFLLISGMLMISTGYYLNFKNNDAIGKFMLLLGLSLSIVFSGLISFNYICQTTFIRNLAINYRSEYDPAISTFSMANTLSLSWAIEMWGYAFLGLSTALSATYYKDRSNLIAALMILNGVLSICGALFTIVNVDWVMTKAGLTSYFGWNILMIVIMTLIYRESVFMRPKAIMT